MNAIDKPDTGVSLVKFSTLVYGFYHLAVDPDAGYSLADQYDRGEFLVRRVVITTSGSTLDEADDIQVTAHGDDGGEPGLGIANYSSAVPADRDSHAVDDLPEWLRVVVRRHLPRCVHLIPGE